MAAEARYASVEELLRALGGTTKISKVLIANNGIAAVKAIRSIRQWAFDTFGNEREIGFVVMATPQDLGANAEYIRMADEFVEVPGGSNNNNYANVRLIIETAESTNCDAVWAGWGHASENPALPTGLLAAKRPIMFIGPPAKPMYALGDKIGSTIIAQSAGVPCIAWNGASLRCDYKATNGIPDEIYRQADVRTVEEAQAAAEGVGYPLMIKASEGGGGKGIRKVTEPSALPAAFRQVAGEVPGSPIFLMRLAPRARHLEVQLLADAYGNAIALYGRDCSVQRRHQKIVEEGPVLAAPPATWARMERAAVALAKEVGYVNAGTVEYLFMEDDGSFAFLELNPRLQVEHPVTEMVTGVNLPAAQLCVAMGIPLAHIPDVRRLYGLPPRVDVSGGSRESLASAAIDFDTAQRVPPRGHVIAARITAENPDTGFQPTSGAVTELNFRSTPDVWGYFSVDSSGRVHEFADSQIGHLFSFAPCREEARRHMVLALKELSIRGDIRTTVEYLIHMMGSEDFTHNRISTAWLDNRISSNVTAAKPDPRLVAMVGAVWRSHAAYEKRRAEFCGYLDRGQYPPPSLLSVDDNIELIHSNVKYCLHATRSAPGTVTLSCNGSYVTAGFRPLSDGGLLVILGARSHLAYAVEEAGGLRLVLDGATCLFTNEYDPTTLRAAMSGKVARYLVEDGAHMGAGAAFAEVEVMKMYMPLTIPEAGRISLLLPEGSVLEPGDVIARVELDDPSKVHKSELFRGKLPSVVDVGLAAAEARAAASSSSAAVESSPPAAGAGIEGGVEAITGAAERYARRWHTVARAAARTLNNVVSGFVIPRDTYDAAWFDRDAAFSSPSLPLLEVEEQLAVLSSRLPARLVAGIATVVTAHKEAVVAFLQAQAARAAPEGAAAGAPLSPSAFIATSPVLDVSAIGTLIDDHAAALPPRELPAFSTLAAPLRELADKYREGVAGAGRAQLLGLLRGYLAVEKIFGEGRRPEDVLADLRSASGAVSPDEFGTVFDTMRAHVHLKQRNILVLSALQRIGEELELAKASAAGAAGSALNARSPDNAPPSSLDGGAGAGGDSHSQHPSLPLLALGSAPGGAASAARNNGDSFAFSVSSRSLGSEAAGAGGGVGPQGAGGPGLEGGDNGPRSSSPETLSVGAEGGGEDEDELALDITKPLPRMGDASAAASALAAAATGSGVRHGAAVPQGLRAFWPTLHQLAELRGVEYAEVTLEARQLLITHQLPSRTQRRAAVKQLLHAMGPRTVGDGPAAAATAAAPSLLNPRAAADSGSVGDDAMSSLVEDEQPLTDELMGLFGDSSPMLRANAAEVYVRRLYRNYHIKAIEVLPPAGELGGELENGGPASAAAATTAPRDFLAVRWVFSAVDAAAEAEAEAVPAALVGGAGSAPLAPAHPLGRGRVPSGVAGASKRAKGSMSIAESFADLQQAAAAAIEAAAAAEGGSGASSAAGSVPHGPSSSSSATALPLSISAVHQPQRGSNGALGQRGGASSSGGGLSSSDTALPLPQMTRSGAMAVFASLPHFVARFPALLALLSGAAPSSQPPAGPQQLVNVLHVSLLRSPTAEAGFQPTTGAGATPTAAAAGGRSGTRSRLDSGSIGLVPSVAESVADDEALERGVVADLTRELAPFHDALRAVGLRRITFMVPNPKDASTRSSHTPLHDTAVSFAAACAVAASLQHFTLHLGPAAPHASVFFNSNGPTAAAARAPTSSSLGAGLLLGASPLALSSTRSVLPAVTADSPTAAAGGGAPGAEAPGVLDLAADALLPLLGAAAPGTRSSTNGFALLARFAAGAPGAGGATPALGSGTSAAPGAQAPDRPRSSASSSFGQGFPWIYTFRSTLGYAEDAIVRHMQPPSSANLELTRLSAFRIRLVPTPNRIVHVYAAEPKEEPGKGGRGGEPDPSGSSSRPSTRMRFFVRCVVRQTDRIPTLDAVYEQYPGPERMFVECLDALSVAMGDALQDTTLPVGNNHIFLNVLPVASVRPEYVEAVTKILARRYSERLRRLRVSLVEFKINVQAAAGAPPVSIRLVSSNPTGYVLRVDTYVESRDPEGAGVPIFTSIAPAALSASFAAGSGSALMAAIRGAGAGVGGGVGGWGQVGLSSPGGGSASSGGLGTPAFSGSSPRVPFTPYTGGTGPQGSNMLASLGLSRMGLGLGGVMSPGMGLFGAGNGPSAYRGDLDGRPVNTPYPVTSPFERQRALAAALSDTIYAYDFIELITRALEHEWSRYERTERNRGASLPVRRPRQVLSAVELVLRPKGGKGGGAGGAGPSGLMPSGATAAAVTHSVAAGGLGAGGPGPSPAPVRRNPSVFADQYSNEMAASLGAAAGGGAGSGRGAGAAPHAQPSSSPDGSASPLTLSAADYQAAHREAAGNAYGGPMAPGGAGSATGRRVTAPTAPVRSDMATAEGIEYELVESSRPPGCNDIGMVAWRLVLATPQYPEETGGREIILIANDITFRAGSFGQLEDTLFYLASAYARERGVPRVYLAANSGARIGLAEEVKRLFRVAWNDPAEPSKGFKYLYLSPEDYARLNGLAAGGSEGGPAVGGGLEGGAAAKGPAGAPGSGAPSAPDPLAPGPPPSPASSDPPPVSCRRIVDEGEERWLITDIIGREPDLGVENLRGSGTIAGETSRAYASSFTLTYVTGRSVGIGAYLVRLGQRTIQKRGSAPIILTGYEALNKLMGSDVYTSNLQIGGPKIMFSNGVAHDVVDNDYEGVVSILRWLAFVPSTKGAPLPVHERGDDVNRDVAFEPPSQPYDPRYMIAGFYPEVQPPATATAGAAAGGAAPSPAPGAPVTSWVSGVFDKDSWRECLAGWAKSVVVGRARLGGIPVGIITPELRATTAIVPADPASPASKETVLSQAGQVWYPDSAFKTAQALRDFAGEDLPVFIFANWRGFSGGQRDMFDEVLKFGSYIVDALVATTQPVFVYIPPHAELRGGAWVVVDPTINPDVMEMYADPSGRGGVLEPSGTASIKFRAKELVASAHRLDPLLRKLDAQLRTALAAPGAAADPSAPAPASPAALRRQIRSREEALAGIYLQVAHTFADLHDTPGRMVAKGVIHGVVPFRRARSIFYWRLRRKLAEYALIRRLIAAAPQLDFGNSVTLLRSWYRSHVIAAEGAYYRLTSVGGALGALAGPGHHGGEGAEAADAALWRDDVRVLRWLAETRDGLEARALDLRKESIAETVLALGQEDPSAVLNGVLALIGRLSTDRREAVVAALRRCIIFGQASPVGMGSGLGGGAGGPGAGGPGGQWF